MTQFIVFQRPADPPEGVDIGPQLIMAALVEADSAQNAVQNVISVGSFSSGGSIGVLDASDVAAYEVAVSAKVSTPSKS
jgi:hypothetical protein